jgi:hypothetical protein
MHILDLEKFLFLFEVQFVFVVVNVINRNVILRWRRRIFARKLKVSIFWIYRGRDRHTKSEERWTRVFRMISPLPNDIRQGVSSRTHWVFVELLSPF